jgi:hypothetical protein
MTLGWLLDMSMRLAGIYRTPMLVIGIIALLALAFGLWFFWHDDRAYYLELSRGRYNPSFFLEYDLARRNRAGWLGDPFLVAWKYAYPTNLCPDGSVRQLPAETGKAIYIFTNKCLTGIYAAKRYRVDLIEQDGVWDIEWSGALYKCTRGAGDVGTLLMANNPLRQYRNPMAGAINTIINDFAFALNSWRTLCM